LTPFRATGQRRILVVDDERNIADLVALHLRDNGFDARQRHYGDQRSQPGNAIRI